jgi:antibiotic biosynthesis monooxygenase (ABM) superfamily enzyme
VLRRRAASERLPFTPREIVRQQKEGKLMAWLQARHAVADFEKWKPAFAATEVPLRKRFFVFAVEGDRNDLLVMEEFDTREDARAWIDSPDHAEAVARAGVSAPEFLFLEELEEGR